jgi:hypothetical protein
VVTAARVRFSYVVDLRVRKVSRGELKLIAVTRENASVAAHATMVKSGMPGFEINGWYGMVYPAEFQTTSSS